MQRGLRLLQLVADRAGLGLERSRLDDADRKSRTLADRTRHATLLAAASDAVAAAEEEYERNLSDLVDVVVPAFSDWCAIDLLDVTGPSRRVVIRHGDEGATAVERNSPQEAWCSAQLRVRVPGIAEMISTGSPPGRPSGGGPPAS